MGSPAAAATGSAAYVASAPDSIALITGSTASEPSRRATHINARARIDGRGVAASSPASRSSSCHSARWRASVSAIRRYSSRSASSSQSAASVR